MKEAAKKAYAKQYGITVAIIEECMEAIKGVVDDEENDRLLIVTNILNRVYDVNPFDAMELAEIIKYQA